jgi:hypothetical protein
MTNLLVFVVVVGEDVGFETASSSSFIITEELQFLEAFFFDLGACLRLFRFLFPFAKNDDERSSSTMFFSEEPSTLFSVHSTSSSSSSSVVPSSRVAFISIHPRKKTLSLCRRALSFCELTHTDGFLLLKCGEENVNKTRSFSSSRRRKKKDETKAFLEDALSLQTLPFLFCFLSRELRELCVSPFFSRFLNCSFFL